MNIALITTLIIFVISELAFIYFTFKAQNRIKDLNKHYDMIKKIMDTYYSEVKKYNELLNKLIAYDKNREVIYESLLEQYDTIKDQFDIMDQRYTEVTKAWKEIEERYSQTYEQFRECSREIKDLKEQSNQEKDIKFILDKITDPFEAAE